jgi:two-component system phosphate regulon sensor histidine kinase PhoR
MVTDNGPGIPLRDQPHIFERFYRVHKDRSRDAGGTGLGLSIVKHTMQLLGGTVSIENSPGQGATFVLRLPRGL